MGEGERGSNAETDTGRQISRSKFWVGVLYVTSGTDESKVA